MGPEIPSHRESRPACRGLTRRSQIYSQIDFRIVGHPEVIHFICRGTARRPASGLFQAARLATHLPLFPRRLQLPVLVTVRSVRLRLSRTIQGPKSQPESCFGRMCLTPEKQRSRQCVKHYFISPSTQSNQARRDCFIWT